MRIRNIAAAVVTTCGLFLATNAYAGNILIVNGSVGTSEPGTTAAITLNLKTLHEAVGNTVTVSSGIPADFLPYSQIWDIRFSNTFAITADERADYIAFLAGGGGMFVMGENSGFASRNDSIFALINEAGGGDLEFVTPGSTQDVVGPFTGPNAVVEINYAAPGGVSSKGTGDWITKVNGMEQGTGVAWGLGDLANAPLGALTVIFDVNFMQNQYDLPNSQNLTKNLIGFVQDQVDPPGPKPVPDSGATVALLGLGLMGLIQIRKYLSRPAA